eukprot:tig00021126_g18480.t1
MGRASQPVPAEPPERAGGEKRKEEEVAELTAAAQTKSDVVNGELAALSAELGEAHKLNQLDGFNLYLYGVVLKESEHKAQARDVLVASIDAYPWNWRSCWRGGSKPEYMKDMFLAHVALEFQNSEESLALYESLQQLFPLSNYLLAQTAIAKYNQREFDEAQEEFEELESRAPLSFLAHTATQLDKYRPETCCIVGNYYSLRASTRRRHHAYRTAVDINARDYRAWPYDARMWCAMADCYEKMQRWHEAIKCYERAECHSDREGIALSKLARLYCKQLNMADKAAFYYKRNLDKRDAEELDGQETVEALLFSPTSTAPAATSRPPRPTAPPPRLRRPREGGGEGAAADMRSEQGQRRGLSAKFSP